MFSKFYPFYPMNNMATPFYNETPSKALNHLIYIYTEKRDLVLSKSLLALPTGIEPVSIP